MSKKYLSIFISLLSVFLLSACNSSKSSNSNPSSTVSFFHNIQGKGVLQLTALNTSARNSYGTVQFNQFGSAVSLTTGQWGLCVEENTGECANSTGKELVQGTFNVTANQTNIIAVTDDPDNAGQYLIHTLKQAQYSTVRVINVSNLQSQANQAVDVYIIPATETGADNAVGNFSSFDAYKLGNIAFGKTSANLELPVPADTLGNDDYGVYVYLTKAGDPASVLYQSSEHDIATVTQQTLIISPNYNPDAIQPYSIYYYQGVNSERWDDRGDLNGKLRFFNAGFDNANPSTVTTTPALPSAVAPLAVGDVSADAQVDADLFYNIYFDGHLNTNTYLASGDYQTIIFYGDGAGTVSSLKAFWVKEQQNVVSGVANVTVSNAMYFASSDEAYTVDVYFYKQGENPYNMNPQFEDLGTTNSTNQDFNVLDTSPTLYEIMVTKSGGVSSPRVRGFLQLQGGKNYHVVITGNYVDGSIKLCDLGDTSTASTSCTPL